MVFLFTLRSELKGKMGFPGGSFSKDSDCNFLVREDPLEKGMATHCSILAWRIPWTEEPGGLQSMELQSVGHDQATNTSTYKEKQCVTEALSLDYGCYAILWV